jgi:hypothetical protein
LGDYVSLAVKTGHINLPSNSESDFSRAWVDRKHSFVLDSESQRNEWVFDKVLQLYAAGSMTNSATIGLFKKDDTFIGAEITPSIVG